MSVALDAFPQPRTQRAPPGTNPPPTQTTPQVPRMRLFSLSRPSHLQTNNVMVSPRCQGPAVIKDFILTAPNAIFAANKAVRILISDNDGGGIADSATIQTPSGDVIFEDLLFKYIAAPTTATPRWDGIADVYTSAGQRIPGTVIPLDFPVNRSTFFLKVYILGESQALEGMIRVIEGVDLTRFF